MIVLASPLTMVTGGLGPVAAQSPDFMMLPQWTTASFLQGEVSSTNRLNLTSLGGFDGTVYLSSSTPYPTSTVFLGLYQTSVLLSAGATNSAQFYVSIGMNAPSGNYTVWITGGSGSIVHYVQLTVTVKQAPRPPPDFSIGANPSTLSVRVSSASTSAIGLYGSYGYNGNISLTATPFPQSLSAIFDRNTVRLSGTQSATSTLTLQGNSSGYFSVKVTATDGLNTHSIGLSVQVYTDQIIPGPTTLSYALSYRGIPYPGGSTNLLNNFTNLGISTIRVARITISTDFGSFTPTETPLLLDPGQERTLQLGISIPQSVIVGNHTITVHINWQYANSSSWVDEPPLSVIGYLPVAPSPPTLNSFFAQTLGGLLTDTRLQVGVLAYLAIASVATLLFARYDHRQRSRPRS